MKLTLALGAALAAVAASAPVERRVGGGDPGPSIQSLLELPTGFAAMMTCSGLFNAGLPLEVAIAEDCDLACLLANVTVDYAERSVTAVLRNSGGSPIKSIWRGDGIGCTVVDGITEAELRAQDIGDQAPLPRLNATVDWPLGDKIDLTDLPGDVDWAAVNEAIEADFATESFNTRAVVVVHRGRVVAERYADGITPETRLLGWSMTKSITGAFIGILTGEGRLNLSDPAPVTEWNTTPGDPRATITLNNMMQMASGILWREAPGDVRCIFTAGEGDCAGREKGREGGRAGGFGKRGGGRA